MDWFLVLCSQSKVLASQGHLVQDGLRFRVVDLGLFNALALNDRGQFVGDAGQDAVLVTGGRMKRLMKRTPRNGEEVGAEAYAINNTGDVVGTVGGGPAFMSESRFCGAAIWEAPDYCFRDVPECGVTCEGRGLNGSGAVVGNGNYRGFYASNGLAKQIRTLSHLSEGNTSSANAVNNHGQAVGTSTVVSASDHKVHEHGFRWSLGHSLVDLGALPGFPCSSAVAINDLGDAVGYVWSEDYSAPKPDTKSRSPRVQSCAVLWKSARIVRLPSLGSG